MGNKPKSSQLYEDEEQSSLNDANDRDEIEFVGSFAEAVSNGKPIDWRYWMSMNTLSAQQASRLLVGLDPDIYEEISTSHTKNNTDGERDRAKKIERLAVNIGLKEASAQEWLEWAKNLRLNIHPLFALGVSSIKSAQFQPSTVESHSEAPDTGVRNIPTERPSTTIHRVGARNNYLKAVIAKAKEIALNPDDPHSHWAAFIALADSANRPSPLLGYDEDGVKYRAETGDGVSYLSKANFIRRIKRGNTAKGR